MIHIEGESRSEGNNPGHGKRNLILDRPCERCRERRMTRIRTVELCEECYQAIFGEDDVKNPGGTE